MKIISVCTENKLHDTEISFAIFIGFEVEITGKILKTRLSFSKT